MKKTLLVSLLLLVFSLQLLAQNQASLNSQVVGTWKMTSQKGVDFNGNAMDSDISRFKQYKILTPTHWMYVNYNTDSTKGSGDFGTYTMTGNKYVEALTDNYKTDFTLKVEGNKLYQDGYIIAPDGKKAMLHEVYERVEEPVNQNKDIVGVWEMISTKDIKDGKEVEVTDMKETTILTPSHYMWVQTKKDGSFDGSMVGTYKKEGRQITPTPIIASFPLGEEKVEILVDVKGDQMLTKGKLTNPDGTIQQWTSVHRNVGKAKIAKATSVK